MANESHNSRLIKASPEAIYNAFLDPIARETWQAPGDMVGKIHDYDFSEGGGYTMSLFYSDADRQSKGKTSSKEDRFTSRFIELVPNKKIVESVRFHSDDPKFSGEMIMQVSLKPVADATEVQFSFKNIPEGISPADNEAGTISTLEKLANYVE